MTDVENKEELQTESNEVTEAPEETGKSLDDVLNKLTAGAQEDAEPAPTEPQDADADKPAAEAPEGDKEVATTSDAPAHWSNQDREEYGAISGELSDKAKEFIKNMDARWKERHQAKVTELRNQTQEMDEVFKPYRQALEARGSTPAQAVAGLIAERNAFLSDLAKDPIKAIKEVAARNGISLNLSGVEDADDDGEYVDPKVRELEEKLNRVNGQFTNYTNQQEQQRHLQTINQFADAKDEEGKLKHPHFDKVSGTMMEIVAAAQATGRPVTIEQAYEQAVFLNPDVREQLIDERASLRVAESEKNRRADVEKARKAKTNLSGHAPARKMRSSTPTIDEALDGALKRLSTA